MIKFSVVLPVYNVEQYLKECLDSIINQTYKNLEIICINDCSEDNSLEILKEYAEKDNRIKVIEKSARGGLGAARNTALNEILAIGGGSEHNYVSFIDSDDYIAPNMYEILAQKIEETPADIICFNYFTLKNGIELKEKIYYEKLKNEYYTKENLKTIFMYDLSPMVWNKIYSKEFLQKNNLRFSTTPIQEDVHFNFYAKLCAQSVLILKDLYLYYYRIREKSLSNTYDEKYMATIQDIKETKDDLIKKNIFNEYKEEFKNYRDTTLRFSQTKIPEEKRLEYVEKSKILFDKSEEKIFNRNFYNRRNPLENLFSIYNHYNPKTLKKEKTLQIFGIKIILSKKSM